MILHALSSWFFHISLQCSSDVWPTCWGSACVCVRFSPMSSLRSPRSPSPTQWVKHLIPDGGVLYMSCLRCCRGVRGVGCLYSICCVWCVLCCHLMLVLVCPQCTEGYEYDRGREQCRGEKWHISFSVKLGSLFLSSLFLLNGFNSIINVSIFWMYVVTAAQKMPHLMLSSPPLCQTSMSALC